MRWRANLHLLALCLLQLLHVDALALRRLVLVFLLLLVGVPLVGDAIPVLVAQLGPLFIALLLRFGVRPSGRQREQEDDGQARARPE
jgi:hypothetical protein